MSRLSRAAVRVRAFEALIAHSVDLEEVVGLRKEPPAELPEPGRSAGGCEQPGWSSAETQKECRAASTALQSRRVRTSRLYALSAWRAARRASQQAVPRSTPAP